MWKKIETIDELELLLDIFVYNYSVEHFSFDSTLKQVVCEQAPARGAKKELAESWVASSVSPSLSLLSFFFQLSLSPIV